MTAFSPPHTHPSSTAATCLEVDGRLEVERLHEGRLAEDGRVAHGPHLQGEACDGREQGLCGQLTDRTSSERRYGSAPSPAPTSMPSVLEPTDSSGCSRTPDSMISEMCFCSGGRAGRGSGAWEGRTRQWSTGKCGAARAAHLCERVRLGAVVAERDVVGEVRRVAERLRSLCST